MPNGGMGARSPQTLSGQYRDFLIPASMERWPTKGTVAKRQHTHRAVIVVLIRGAHFLLEGREDQGIPEMKDEYAHKEPREGSHEAAAIIGKRPIEEHNEDP